MQRFANSGIGDINIKSFQVLVNIFKQFLKHLINLVMSRGVSLLWAVRLFGMDLVELQDTTLIFKDKYLVFQSNIGETSK